MSDSTASQIDERHAVVPWTLQILAWIAGLAVCIVGMLDLIGNWKPEVATAQFVVLAIAPLIFMLPRRRRIQSSTTTRISNQLAAARVDWFICVGLGAIAFTVNYAVGIELADLPPAYHDEFSYLFEAKTLLAGRLSFPSHPVHPELFDQMHVMNEGRMASRYYPGASLWLAPFVAVGYPYFAAWIASTIATMLLYWAGHELGGRSAGLFAGLTLALSPGIALFGTTYLAHQATLMSLSLFLLGVVRWRRTRAASDAWLAGCGLSFAMLCRPMTAAAMGLPFGFDVVVWLFRRGTNSPSSMLAFSRVTTVLGFGLPLLVGWGCMAVYNQAVTEDWLKSPYQVYTEIYTPRHVYGFNNRLRGEQHLGPKVLEEYDTWAKNLTPKLAAQNVFVRWVASWLWTLDVVPLLICTVLVAGMMLQLDRRWMLILLAIVSLHTLHASYWYVGIMGWHYVFETALLWCLITGGVTVLLTADWKRRGMRGLTLWWYALLALSAVANVQFRVPDGLGSLRYPRQKHADLRRWIEEHVERRPALVLVEHKDPHLDLIVNEPGLNADLLLGRYLPGKTDVKQIQRDFPDRSLYVACPDRKEIRRIE